jgi:C-terminal processing protease CtpA/Prc
MPPSRFILPLGALTLLLSVQLAASPHPLSQCGVENLAAFARLLALVRYFHPSDAAAEADWNRVAVAGVEAVEGPEDAAALAGALEKFFQPMAPTLRVYPRGRRPETPGDLRAPAAGRPVRLVMWRHYGARASSKSKIFSSERIDDRTFPGSATLAQAVDAGPLRGRRVRLRAFAKTEAGEKGTARLGLRVLRPGGETGFFQEVELRSPSWRAYEIAGEVDPDAERIVAALVMAGGGRVWLDDVSLEPGGAAFGNPGFETGEEGRQPPWWIFPYDSIRAGYHLALRRGAACHQGACAEIAAGPIATPHFPRPDEVWEADLGAGVAAALPLSLWADGQGTLPPPSPAAPPLPWSAADPGPDTRAARLAAVALHWGTLHHFHPVLEADGEDWRAALPAALAAAAEAPDRETFRRVLRRLAVPLRDDKANLVAHRDDPEPRSLPVAWEWVEDRLVITGAASGAGGLRPGDVVVALDGRPAAAALAEAVTLSSGATPESRRWAALDLLAAGPPGSRATLTIERPGSAPFEATLSRDSAWGAVAGTPLPPVAEPRPGIVYVDLGRISEEEFQPLLPRLTAARGLVFDLRRGSNVSNDFLSYLTGRTAMSSNFQVPVVLRPDRQGTEWLTTVWNKDPREPRLRAPAAFLLDGRSSGYAETFLEMIEHYRWGALVGERSGANNGSVNWAGLPGGWHAVWTGQRTLKHDETTLHGRGIIPTVPATRTLRGISEGRDEQAERAVEIVSTEDR